jgi:subtilase family serine protease
VSSGDEAESDLDLEYSGGIARGATILFVYVGNNSNYSVWDSINYAVDNQIAPIISTSYGDCETDLGSANYSTLNAVLEQAAAQGQSVVAAAGDNGSTDCYGYTNLTTSQQEALAVDFPASSQYVTGMGGTEFPAADVSSSNTTYWESASGSDVISSALSYIPEQVWNDDSSSNGLSSGGGGVSALTSRPRWQIGATGIPSGSYRLVPDVSLDASPNNAGYLFCSSDSSATGISGSCSNGFRDSDDQYLTVAGGTTLYKLASESSTYVSAFHDITSGSNQCTAGSSYCSTSGESDYPATAGYDEASGLGSVDFYNLLLAWPTTTSSALDASTVSFSATTTMPAAGHRHGHDYRGLRFEFGHNHTDWHFDHPSRWDDGNLLSRLIERLCHLLFLFVDKRVAYYKGELLGRFDLRCLNRHIGANSWRVQFILRDFYYCRN